MFFVLTVPHVVLRTHKFYTQKMLTDALMQGTGPMLLFSLVVAGHGKVWQLFQAASCSPHFSPGRAHPLPAWNHQLLLCVWPDRFVLAEPALSRAPCPRTLASVICPTLHSFPGHIWVLGYALAYLPRTLRREGSLDLPWRVVGARYLYFIRTAH